MLVGPNATGKSTILRAINGLNVSVPNWTGDNYVIELPNATNQLSMGYCFMWPSDDWPRSDGGDIVDHALPVLYIPATRVSLPGRDFFNRNQLLESVDKEGTAAPLDALFDTDSGIFYGRFVELAINQLREEMAPSPPSPENRTYGWTPSDMNINRGQQSQLRKVLEVGYSCAKRICLEVMYDNSPHSYVDINEDNETFARYGMGIGTTDDILGEPLYAGALSSGTQGTLLWIWALALKMAHHYDWQEGWQEKPAILLIDEIENHLHPSWQRRVIPALLEHFPGLQIFATTHSPFVVAGLKAGQVHLLKRDEEGRVTATTNTEDIIGWTADEILRTMMGVDDPTDDATAAAASELRKLRNEGASADCGSGRTAAAADVGITTEGRPRPAGRRALEGAAGIVRAAVCRVAKEIPRVSGPQSRGCLTIISIPRSPEPGFLAELRETSVSWTGLSGHDRNRIRDALRSDFGPVCAYCQQGCQTTQPRVSSEDEPPPNEESIDHFRPRDQFPELQFDWLNLIYACYRCNQQKGGKWPVDGDLTNQVLTAAYQPRFTPITEYVNPSEFSSQRSAHEFFDWHFESGEIFPSEQLGPSEWSIAPAYH